MGYIPGYDYLGKRWYPSIGKERLWVQDNVGNWHVVSSLAETVVSDPPILDKKEV